MITTRTENCHCNKLYTHTTEIDKIDKDSIYRLIAVIVIGVCAICGVFIGGAKSNSLSVFNDGVCLSSDVLSFIINLATIYLSTKKETKKYTYGYHRAEVLGGIISIAMMWAVTLSLTILAIGRLRSNPQAVVMEAKPMLLAAMAGLLADVLMAVILYDSCCVCSRTKNCKFIGISNFCNLIKNAKNYDNENQSDIPHQEDGGKYTRVKIAESKPISKPTLKLIRSKKETAYPAYKYTKIKNKDGNLSDEHEICDVGNYDIEDSNLNESENTYENGELSFCVDVSKHNDKGSNADEARNESIFVAPKINTCNINEELKNVKRTNNTETNITIRSAFFHMMGDVIQDLGTVIAAIVIYYKPTLKLVDPISTILTSVIAIVTTWGFMKDAVTILLETVPAGVDYDGIQKMVTSLNGVVSIHDLHVWNLNPKKIVLSAHLVVDTTKNSWTDIQEAVLETLSIAYQIENVTIQLEDCKTSNMSTSTE